MPSTLSRFPSLHAPFTADNKPGRRKRPLVFSGRRRESGRRPLQRHQPAAPFPPLVAPGRRVFPLLRGGGGGSLLIYRCNLLDDSKVAGFPTGEGRKGSEMAHPPMRKSVSVYLYIPNIIGYIRVLMNCAAFALCFSHKRLFAVLYFTSFVCDGLDGWFARKFNQVSTFGAVLDMVTDRVSTACLLTVLSQIYRPGLIFLFLLALDIGSHWLQMYSTFLSGKASHKDVKDSTNWLFRAYYGHRLFMAFCCVGSEVLYIILFLVAEKQPESVRNVFGNIMKEQPLLSLPFFLALFGWAIKQVINVIQMKTAADACVYYDMKRTQ